MRIDLFRRWPVAGVRCPVWPVSGGRCPVACFRWPVAGHRRPVSVSGVRRPAAGGQWPVAGGRCPVAGGRWPSQRSFSSAMGVPQLRRRRRRRRRLLQLRILWLGRVCLVIEHEHSYRLGMDALVIRCSQT